jgi:carboxypeptidase T
MCKYNQRLFCFNNCDVIDFGGSNQMKRINFRIVIAIFATTVITFSTTATSSHVDLLTGFDGKGIRYTIKVDVKSAVDMGRYATWLERRGYDVAGYSWRKGEIEVITDLAGIQKLKQNNLQGFSVESVDNLAIDARYLNPAKVEQKLKDLNARYPHLTRLEQIGTSFQGRAIWALLVSTSPLEESPEYSAKPSIIFDGMHHAREIMTSEVVMDVAENALDILDKNDVGASLLSRWNVWVVPMLNVDGNNLVWTQSAMWRKNARAENNKTFGVDINRNYPFNWKKCNGASDSKSNDTYRGVAGGSETETQALMKLAQKVRPTASLSYHSYSELILYPYGCNGILTGDNALVSSVANELAQVLPNDSGNGNYDPGTPWQLLYSVDGDSMSYMHGEFGAVALTFEINTTFQPRYELKEPTVQKHRRAWSYFLNRMTQGMVTLKVVDGRTNNPVVANIGVSNLQFAQGEKPFRTNDAGYFFKVLHPGSYTLTVQLADGRSQNVQVVIDGFPQTQTVVIN